MLLYAMMLDALIVQVLLLVGEKVILVIHIQLMKMIVLEPIILLVKLALGLAEVVLLMEMEMEMEMEACF